MLLASVDLEWWNTHRFFPRSCRTYNSESKESCINSLGTGPNAAGYNNSHSVSTCYADNCVAW